MTEGRSTFAGMLRALCLALVSLAALAQSAAADTMDRLHDETALGRAFWAARGVTGCQDGFALELVNDPTKAAGQGGSCIVRLNAYWLPPNAWGMDRETECTIVFHEVRHALPGGDVGGIDGQGHTSDGLMAPEPRATPIECIRYAHPRRWFKRVGHGPAKGVVRPLDVMQLDRGADEPARP